MTLHIDRNLIIGLIVGLAVGIGGTLLIAGGDDSGGSSSNPAESASEVTAPAETGPQSGAVGDTLTLKDDYVSDGKPVNEDVDWTLKAVDDNIQLSEIDAQIYGKPGYRWLRLDFEVTQNGSTATDLIAENITAVDSENHTYNAETGVFDPALTDSSSNTISLQPGDTRRGYIAIAVPENSKVTSIRVKDSGYVPPSTAEWKL